MRMQRDARSDDARLEVGAALSAGGFWRREFLCHAEGEERNEYDEAGHHPELLRRVRTERSPPRDGSAPEAPAESAERSAPPQRGAHARRPAGVDDKAGEVGVLPVDAGPKMWHRASTPPVVAAKCSPSHKGARQGMIRSELMIIKAAALTALRRKWFEGIRKMVSSL